MRRKQINGRGNRCWLLRCDDVDDDDGDGDGRRRHKHVCTCITSLIFNFIYLFSSRNEILLQCCTPRLSSISSVLSILSCVSIYSLRVVALPVVAFIGKRRRRPCIGSHFECFCCGCVAIALHVVTAEYSIFIDSNRLLLCCFVSFLYHLRLLFLSKCTSMAFMCIVRWWSIILYLSQTIWTVNTHNAHITCCISK